MAVRAKRRLTQAQRLERLERARSKAVDEIALALFGPADRREVNFRTSENKRAALQKQGLTKSGRRSGSRGRKSMTRKTVADERRARAEEVIEEKISGMPADSPVRQAWERRDREIDELRAATDKGFLGEGGAARVQVKRYCVKAHTRRIRVKAAAGG